MKNVSIPRKLVQLVNRQANEIFPVTLKFSSSYLFCSIRNFIKPIRKTGETIFFDIKESVPPRYIYTLLYTFKEHYNLLLCRKIGFKDFSAPYAHAECIYSIRNCKIVSKRPKKTAGMILVYDSESSPLLKNKWKKTVRLSYDIFYQKKDNSAFILPYQMHPRICMGMHNTLLVNYRNKKRVRRIFFSGTVNRANYDDDVDAKVLRTRFNKLSRIDTIDTLARSLNEDELAIINDAESFTRSANSYKPKFVLCSFRLFGDWFGTLSESDFFLAPSGACMPIAHNIIEAMAVGTIPVTESPEYFSPPLEHLENCIVFSGKEDLVRKVKHVLRMDQELIQRMRQNVVAYFEKHNAPSAVCDKFKSNYTNFSEIIFNAEYLSVEALLKRQVARSGPPC